MRRILKITSIPLIYPFFLCIFLLIGTIIGEQVSESSDVFLNIFTSCSQLVGLIIVIPIYIKLYKWTPRKTISIKNIRFGIITSVILMSSGFYFAFPSIIKFIGASWVQTGSANEPFEISSWITIILHLIGSVIAAPIGEEFCFRIVPLSISKSKTEKIITVIITSLMFAVIHGFNPLRIVELILVSLLYSAIYLRTKNGIYLIIMHSLRNFINLVLDTFAEHNLDYFLSSMAFVKNGYIVFRPILVIFGILMFIIGIVIFMRSNKKPRKDVEKNEKMPSLFEERQ